MLVIRPMSSCLLNVHRVGPVEKILAINKSTARPSFGIVGGKSEPGESPEETCVRETFEETGLTFNSNELVLIYAAVAKKYFSFVYAPLHPVDVSIPLIQSNEGQPTWVYWNDLTFASRSPYFEFNQGLKQAWLNYLKDI